MFAFNAWKAAITSPEQADNRDRLLVVSGLVEPRTADIDLHALICELNNLLDEACVISEDEIATDAILRGLVSDKLALTRDNYIRRAYGQVSKEWNAEMEAHLPIQLQDWDRFDNGLFP